MENRHKIKIVITFACLTALSFFFAKQYRKKRKQSRTCCYLKTESKPQASFKRVLADNSYSPFKHLKFSESNEGLEHPYKAKIDALLIEPFKFKFLEGNVDMEMKESYVWVEKEAQLEELVDILSNEKVIAVDTEQHGLRSFLGFTALIQVSAKGRDYLIDTIALHDFMGILRPVFANPSICKVFHGADNDVIWLQRDFHIYVVNLFDTAKACELLSKPQKSLAYLLETYCNVTTNKQLQREDWRQRPLSAEMVKYAQTDVHYLLYIAHCLALELKQEDTGSSLLLETSRRSNSLCLQLFSKDIEASPGESSAFSIITKHLSYQGGPSSNIIYSQELVRRLCTWRDIMARLHDESLRYVLSDHAIVALAHRVPVSNAEIFETISQADLTVDSLNQFALQSPSPLICSHFEDFHYLFQDKLSDPEFDLILQKHLGPDGSCPLSIYNYALLSKINLKPTDRLVSKQNGTKHAKRVGKKASRLLFVKKFSCKAPVYHNCRIYANDGRMLCYCDRKKLEWYLQRGLAKLVEEDPPAIMLLFEPKGRPEDEDNDFYVQSKKNICVGCGEGNHYLRYRIIPSCYRVHFPEHLKSHRSHDIVLVCVDCHEIAHASAEKHKKKVASEFGIPLFVHRVTDSGQAPPLEEDGSSDQTANKETGVSPLQLRTAAMALLRHGSRIPPSRREELMQVVVEYYGGKEISQDDLERALLVGMTPLERKRLKKKKGLSFIHSTSLIKNVAKKNANGMMSDEVANLDLTSPVDDTLDSTESNGDVLISTQSKLSLLGHGPHGNQVVDHILKEYGDDGIREFCQRWRRVFVEAVHPRFLPSGWDVKHSGRRDFGEFSVYHRRSKKVLE
ncbi:protein RRP6-like 3 isoform X2 [Impatiens glandulifera]|uniref:protein RRP6-like 3 isoform X2 n=1 Tax=Impatiens glandulifera TaxID=253017 RepID=UPI001FB13791|nr:protein RRP6-like 3 isoform X2 [Impatiens glandulifera]